MARKNWQEVRRTLKAEARIRREKAEAILEMNLQELRQNLAGLSQIELSKTLGVTQGRYCQELWIGVQCIPGES